MDELGNAKQEMSDAEHLGYEKGQFRLPFVVAYAAIAQAEAAQRQAAALERIADMVEGYLSLEGYWPVEDTGGDDK
jgi:hypothetical protein